MSGPKPSEIGHRTEISSTKYAGPLNEPILKCKTWIRVQGRYQDRWSTPMAGAEFKLFINGASVLPPGTHLYTHEELGLRPGKAPRNEKERKLYAELGCYYYPNCEHGKARFEVIGDTAASAEADRLSEAIHAKLDGAYRHLKEQMVPYQQMWDAYGWLSLEIARTKGFLEAGEDWIKSWDEVFTTKYWSEMGSSIAEAFSATVDYAAEAGSNAIKKIEDAWDNKGNLVSRAWWQAQASKATAGAVKLAGDVQREVAEMARSMNRTARMAMEIYERRKAILAVPEMVAAGDIDALERFIDTDLAAIEPEMAEELRYNKEWQGTIELLHEGKAAGIFVVYLDLFITAVPPNFYAHLAGKAGFYIFIELVLILIGALLGGAGAAARIGVISARLARLGAAGAGAARKIDKAKDALRALRKLLDAVESSTENLRDLRTKLLKSRRRNIRRGRTTTTLKQRRKTEKRDGRCRICKTKKHHTPLDRRGECDYV